MTSVLVVDDDTRILRMVSSFLRADGYHALTAEDGRSALGLMLDSTPPSLVLLDLNLPDIQGDEVYRQAREKGYCNPIVFISADLRAEQVAQSVGADGFLAKPFDPSDLFQLVEQLTAPNYARVS